MDKKSSRRSNEWSDEDWTILLRHIARNKVIPIIGKDLVRITPPDSQRETTLHDYLARQLLFRLDGSVEDRVYTLNEAVCAYRGNKHEYEKLPLRLQNILRETEKWARPDPLRWLAEITDFRFFVSTTFDSLLERALEQTSLDGNARHPQVIAFNSRPRSREEKQDLPATNDGRAGLPGTEMQPLVYHLLGLVNTALPEPDVAPLILTDEELLDFVCTLNSENREREPVNLLNEFARNHLLLLGCGFSDWLTRLFLRATKRRRMAMHIGDTINVPLEYVVDDYGPDDDLVIFVERFWEHVRVYRIANKVEWVRELHRRWIAANPDSVARLNEPALSPLSPDPIPSPDPSPVKFSEEDRIFISYCHEDAPAARRLYERLIALGAPAWIDHRALKGAEDFTNTIYDQIEKAKYFMPLISKQSDIRLRGYFQGEWNHAAILSKIHVSELDPYIWPVNIDPDGVDVAMGVRRVPKAFLAKHWSVAPNGEPSDQFVEEIKRLYASGK